MSNTVNIHGYTFEIHPITERNWNRVSAVYMFVQGYGSQMHCKYVGETENLRDRIARHERMSDAIRQGANLILVRVTPTEAARMSLERFLIQKIRPPMNLVHA